MKCRISGTGHYAPDRLVTNQELTEILDTSDEWIRERTGIGARYISITESTAEIAAKAGQQAIADAGIRLEELGGILVATTSPEHQMPNTACEVQKLLGISGCMAFDINAACSGFLYALQTAAALIQSGMARHILVIGAEIFSKLLDWSDRSTCVLFGDGAGAAVISASETGRMRFLSGADGSQGEVLFCDGLPRESCFGGSGKKPEKLSMDGRAVFQFAVRKVTEITEELLKQEGLASDQIQWYLFHQANERIIRSVAKRIGQPIEKFPMNMAQYGNTSAASVPILLDECSKKGLLKKGDRLLLSGFGAGLTWSAAYLEWDR